MVKDAMESIYIVALSMTTCCCWMWW